MEQGQGRGQNGICTVALMRKGVQAVSYGGVSRKSSLRKRRETFMNEKISTSIFVVCPQTPVYPQSQSQLEHVLYHHPHSMPYPTDLPSTTTSDVSRSDPTDNHLTGWLLKTGQGGTIARNVTAVPPKPMSSASLIS